MKKFTPQTRDHSCQPLPKIAYRLPLIFYAFGFVTVLSACQEPGQKAGGGPPPPPEVGIIVAKPGEVDLISELPGRVSPFRVAEVRAQVSGIVQKRMFREGSPVVAGQQLFLIDPAPYVAAIHSAEASLARAKANSAQAKTLVDRYAPLVQAKAISDQEYVNAEAALKVAQAEVAVGLAALEAAQINLRYASVTAPISGRIGRALVTEGALVEKGSPTAMAVIQQVDPVYVDFSQSANDLVALQGAVQQSPDQTPVQIAYDDGSPYPLEGRLLFSDISVDPSTGQVTLRAQVPNPKQTLLPGLYVRVKLSQQKRQNLISIPQQAAIRNPDGATARVVQPNGVVTEKKIKIKAGKDNQWVVLDGLNPGDQVLVDGAQKLQMLPPGTPVRPIPWKPANLVPPEQAPNTKSSDEKTSVKG